MGKAIQTKYSNVSGQIIKKKKEIRRLGAARIKRKLKDVSDHKGPAPKIPRLSDDNGKGSITVPNDEFLNEQVSVKVSDGSVCLNIGNEDTFDLFMDDELRNCNSNFIKEDFYAHIFEEISLEGLDGITIEDFWKRFVNALEAPLELGDGIKEIIWNIIMNHGGFQFFLLPEPRPPLYLPDNFKYHYDLGIIMDVGVVAPDIYPHKMVLYKDVQGSCALFDDRRDITENIKSISLKKALNEYGRKLVIVANQAMRTAALRHASSDPAIVLGNAEYCILERIGRSRKVGEHTQGPCSINRYMNSDCRSTFHHLKILIQHNFVTKQYFFAKLLFSNQITVGKLMHLTRYHKRFKPGIVVKLERIINTLRQRPSLRMAKSEIPNYRHVRKFIQSYDATKYINIDAVCTYADLYPDAEEEDKRLVQCIELIDPNVNIASIWFRQNECDDEDEANNEDDEDGGELKGLSEGPIHNMDLLRGVYYHIAQNNQEGLTVTELAELLDMNKILVRISLRKLIRMDVIETYNLDRGRQRTMKYCLKSIEATQFLEDRPIISTEKGPVSKLKLRMLERQKECIQRRKLEHSEEEQTNVESLNTDMTTVDYHKILSLEPCNVPKDNCDFLVAVFRRAIEHSVIFYSTPPITLVRKLELFVLFRNFKDVSVDFIKVLRQLEPQTCSSIGSTNTNYIVTSHPNSNHIMKLVLLKAHFQELTINSESLNSNRKRKLTESEGFAFGQLKVPDSMRKLDIKLDYMGDNPETVLQKKEDGVDIQIMVSTKPKVVRLDELYLDDSVSPRVSSRIQMVLDYVNSKKLVEDMYSVILHIRSAERQQGYTESIDRRSLYRILSKLVAEGYVKVIQVTIANNELSKTQVFLCHPSINHNNTAVDTACKQLKWKYFVGTSKNQVKVPKEKLNEKLKNISPFKQDDVIESIFKLQTLRNVDVMANLKQVSSVMSAQLYGYKPKFSRLRVLHEFMFYLIYDYPLNSQPLSKHQVAELFESYSIHLSDEELQNLPEVYCNEISWKTFVPPLPVHKAWPTGWALMCDILLRLPISVFCKITYVGYESDELKEILSHPLKRFYRIKDLSQSLRNFVLYERKYMFRLSESVNRLATCGLVQYGPRKFKDKDQVFIYLNRRASLLDTTTSEPHYNCVTEKHYDKIPFYFNSMLDLDSYWHKMYTLAIATPLNTRQPGQLVTYTGHEVNPSLKNAHRSKTIREALDDDNGDIPGDNRGAAGIDSSLWCHLIRNWVWTKKSNKMNMSFDMPIPSLGLKTDVLTKFKNTTTIKDLDRLATNKVYLHKRHKNPKKDSTKTKRPKNKDKTPQIRVSSKAVVTRRLPARFKKTQVKIDNVDKILIKKLGHRRVNFSEDEMHLLLLLKIGDAYLSQNRVMKQLIPYSILRDIMHKILPESRDKSSRAIGRATKKVLMQNRSTIKKAVYILMNDKNIQSYYGILPRKFSQSEFTTGRGLLLNDLEMRALYIFIMAYILQNEDKVFQKNQCHIDHLTAENLENNKEAFVDVVDISSVYQRNPRSEEEIKKEVIQNVIFCSITSRGDPDLGLKLYTIYDKYSEEMLRVAFNSIRARKLISIKKLQKLKRETLISHNLFRIHQNYFVSQSSTFHTVTAELAYKTLLDYLSEKSEQLQFSKASAKEKHYGQLLGINEGFSFWSNIRIEVDLPDKTVVLNPDIEDHSELVEQLAMRQHLKMKRADHEQAEAEQDNENENDNERPHQSEIETGEATVDSETPPEDMEDNDLAVENAGVTIDRLKNWVSDCMEAEKVRRSPSPEFMDVKEENIPVEKGKKENSENNVKTSDDVNCPRSAPKTKPDRTIPSLEQIKEEMMKTSDSNEPRMVPHITELSDLLDQFHELKTPEATISRLKKHFINKYPTVKHVHVEDVEKLRNFYFTDYLINNRKINIVWKRVWKDAVMPDIFTTMNIEAVIRDEGGKEEDVTFTNHILEFVKSKKAMGAVGPELKDKFQADEKNMPLIWVLNVLVKNGILLRTGITQITFVYYKYRHPWVIDTYKSEDKSVDIETQLRNKQDIQAIIMPWTKLDGSLNEDIFKTWLCNILSVCLDSPKVTFPKICQRFKYIKPVDIFYLLEILEELGCIYMFTYEAQENSPFCDWEPPQEYAADFLTNLNDIFVETNNVSMTILGSFFHKGRDSN